MSVIGALESMRSRMPWRVAQRILQDRDIPRGRGWEETITKLQEEDLSEHRDALTDIVRQHSMCGEKLTSIYNLEAKDRSELIGQISRMPAPDNAYSKAYPLTLGEAELGTLSATLRHAKTERFDDGLAVFFGSVRRVEIREDLDASDLPEEARDALDDYDQIIGVKHRRIHAIDVVWIPTNGDDIDVRVDFPPGTPRQLAEAAKSEVLAKITGLIGDEMKLQAVNLFPAIKSIYSAAQEGKVAEMSFSTDTGSLKNEKMRRRKLCLRKEAYHVGGKAALASSIDPFSLSIVWDRGNSNPELTLHSTARMTGQQIPYLYEAGIARCTGRDDYDFVRERLLHHLP